MSVQIHPNTIDASIAILLQRGVEFSSFIDVGCADGDFILSWLTNGWLKPHVKGLNIDANAIYEDSLSRIKSAVPADYRICAVSDENGEIEITRSEHSYWDSVRPAGDVYWTQMNHLLKDTTKIPCFTLDHLVEECRLQPPYLLKMDIQGAEAMALAGGKKMLEQTNVIIVESDLGDFSKLYEMIYEAGFQLFDITTINRIYDHSLGWFYPVYVRRSLDMVGGKQFWPDRLNAEVIEMQKSRRAALLENIRATTDRILSER